MREPPRTPPRCLCDVAIASGEAAFIHDVADAAMHDGLRALAEQLDIHAAWSQPIHSAGSGEVVGTLSTTYDKPHEPSRHELLVGELACSLVAIALERVATEARLAHQALHDSLTGLPNRSLLVDRLDHALEPHAPHRWPRSPCCSATSTGSRWSTTAWATAWATSSSWPSPTGSWAPSIPATRWPASAVTSSWSCSRT